MTHGSAEHVRGRPISIRDFITDGTLSRLCQELTELTGVVVELRDEHGLVLPPGAGPEHPGNCEPLPEGSLRIPLLIEGTEIGTLCVHPGSGSTEGGDREHLDQAVRLLASAATELCRDVVELRARLTELGVLHRLSAVLASGGRLRSTMKSTLKAALEALELDAGSIVLLPEDADGLARVESEEDLTLQASVGLSKRFLRDPMPLSKDRAFDRMALLGEVVEVADLQADERILEPRRCVREQLGSFINAGMIFSGRPLGVIRLYGRTPRRFGEADQRLLRSIGQQAAAAVEQARLARIRARERRIQRSLQLAGEVQSRMLPQQLPSVERFDIAARCTSSFELGGDFYDVFELDGRLFVVIGDVVGKGVAAALLMSAVRASLRAHAEEQRDLPGVIERVNRDLCRDTLPSEFATLWFGVFDPGRCRLTSVSAGHDPPILVRRTDGAIRISEFEIGGLVVGVNADERYEQQSLALERDDLVVIYTDGVTDASSFAGERFGKQRLKAALSEFLREHPDASATVVLDHLHWSIRRFSGLQRQADDETIAIVRVGA